MSKIKIGKTNVIDIKLARARRDGSLEAAREKVIGRLASSAAAKTVQRQARREEVAGAYHFADDTAPIITTVEQRIRASKLYQTTFVEAVNQTARKFKLAFKLLAVKDHDLSRFADSSGVEELTRALIAAKWDLEKVAGKVDGWAQFPTAIHDAIRLALALRESNDVGFEAETQYGKTIVLVMAKLFHTMWIEANGNDEVMVLVNPSRDAPHSQTEHDEEMARDIHAALRLAPSGRPAGEILREIKTGVLGSDNVVVKRATRQKIEKIIDAAFRARKKIVTLVIDEADEASGETSNIYNWLAAFNKRHGGAVKVRMLLCSATAYQFKFIDTFTMVSVDKDALVPGCGYSGTFRGDLTPVGGFTLINDLLVAKGALKDRSLENFNLPEWSKMNSADQKKGAAAVLAAIEGFADGFNAPSVGLNGKPFNGGEGMMLRFGSERMLNELLAIIGDQVAARGIALVRFYGSHPRRTMKSNRTVARMIDMVRQTTVMEQEANALGLSLCPRDYAETMAQVAARLSAKEIAKRASNVNYIVCVLGAGRRADRFPNHTTCFLDFTANFSNSVAMEQGTMGRASGWGKITKKQSTFVMVSDDNAEMIDICREYFRMTGKKAPINGAGPNTIIMDDEDGKPIKLPRPTTKSVVEIYFDQFEGIPAFDGLRRDLEELVGNRVQWKASSTMSGLKIGFVSPEGQDISELGYRAVHTTRKAEGKAEARKVVAHYFDFWSLMVDGRLEIIQNELRARLNAPTMTLLAPGEAGSGMTRDEETGEMVPEKWAYDTFDGNHVRVAINNDLRSMHGGTDDQRETTQRKTSRRDWAKDDASERRPNLFFQPIGATAYNAVHVDRRGKRTKVTKYRDPKPTGGKLVKFSLTTKTDFRDYGSFILAAAEIAGDAIVTLPRAGTAYFGRASQDQQDRVFLKMAENGDRAEGKSKGRGRNRNSAR